LIERIIKKNPIVEFHRSDPDPTQDISSQTSRYNIKDRPLRMRKLEEEKQLEKERALNK
jgi:hypothetical protein